MNFPSCSHTSEDQLNAFQMVRICCESFDEHGEPLSDFPHILFMVGEWLMEMTELMAQLVALYQEEYSEYGVKICYAIGYWIRNFPAHFDANAQLCKLVERLKKMAIDDGVQEEAVHELDVSSVPSYAWLRNVSVRNPVSRHVSLSFEQWSPEDISTSMSHIDYKVLSRVTIPELKKYVKCNKLNQTPILERSIAVFNSLSSWVQCMILSKSTPRERAEVIVKFVNVGKHLRKLHNFNTLMAVIGGVTHSNISRLSKTHAQLPPEIKKDLTALTQLLSNHSNFSQYRKTLQETKSRFKIPIMGVHLKDLIVWHNNALDFEKTRVISGKRLYQLAHLLSYFLGVNRMTHNFPDPNMDLINTLKVSLDISYNENDIYDLSLKREPRTLLNFQAGSSRSVVFADWASGVCQAPDPETINKHISDMVEAVFKHYDHDRDAYISQQEFEQIAGNFPFIDPFTVIDVDRDGQISKSEMKAYFINLNKQSTEFRRGFKHNFHETTFLTPAICAHCNKILWGLIRQGFKCKDCALIVHSACKDVAVAECRRRRTGLSGWLYSPRNGTTANNGNQKKGIFLNYSFYFLHLLLQVHFLQIYAVYSTHRRSLTSSSSRTSSQKSSSQRSKNRTVSTVSESSSPEPPLTATSEPSSLPQDNNFRSSFHRFIRPAERKNRAVSETADCFRSRNDSPDVDPENLASLASEEVFDDESNSSLASARSKNSPNLRRSQRHSSRRLSPTYENSHEGLSR